MKGLLQLCPCLGCLRSRKHGDSSADKVSLKEIEGATAPVTSEPPPSTSETAISQKPTEELDEPWYFGKMNRFDAVALLESLELPIGTFLLRVSDHDQTGFVLSVKSSSRVKHIKIHQDANNFFYIDPATHFSSLRHLVTHYSKNTLAMTETLLGQPCPKPKGSEGDARSQELPKAQFTLEEELSSGHYANVYKGTWNGRVSVAIKTFKDPRLTRQVFLNEVRPLMGLQQRHLVSLLAVCAESSPFYIVMELMGKSSLLHFLRGPEGQLEDIVSLMDMASQVVDGMCFLEMKGIIHKDLAARNVLVGDTYVCKVADFGLSTVKCPYEDAEPSSSAVRWSAPETVSHDQFSSQSDVWSFGVLLYEIITFGGSPYPALKDSEVYDHVSEGYRMPCPPKCPSFLYRVMVRCWSSKPQDRPSFGELMRELDSISYEQQN